MKNFTAEHISSQNLMKSSVQRSIRATLLNQYPLLESVIDNILPKKNPAFLGKCANHVTVIICNNELLFFQIRNGPWMPNLRLVHKYPFMMPIIKVDKGAIKHVLRGSNIMCPGVTSIGEKIEEVNKDQVIQIMGQGKEFALAIGITTMSTQEIIEKNKDVCIENMHYLNDGVWNFKM